jgi:uncharacterized repeat protein (TIGR03803 family)
MPIANSFRAVLMSAACVAALIPAGAFAGTESVLYAFRGFAAGDGDGPNDGVVFDQAGNLYGTTLFGGKFGTGTVFMLTQSSGKWQETVLHSFAGGEDGESSYGGLLFDRAGHLFGTTRFGGSACNCGTVYELQQRADGTWNEKVIYAFHPQGVSDGSGPLAGLTLDSQGNLYGTTLSDDRCGGGTVFELERVSGGWREHILHRFCAPDGTAPAYGRLVFDQAGNLYGTTGFGGSGLLGVVFELSPQSDGSWNYQIIHAFTQEEGGIADGGLTIDSAGNLYGAEADGGPHIKGAIYEFSPLGDGQWHESILYTFKGSPDGKLPFQNPLFDQSGNLIGTTYAGGKTSFCSGCGTIYQLQPQADGGWKESVVYDFANLRGGADGYQPVAGLTGDGKGNFYGTTTKGGRVVGPRPCSCGVVYKFTP